jgi:hypothetical protein
MIGGCRCSADKPVTSRGKESHGETQEFVVSTDSPWFWEGKLDTKEKILAIYEKWLNYVRKNIPQLLLNESKIVKIVSDGIEQTPRQLLIGIAEVEGPVDMAFDTDTGKLLHLSLPKVQDANIREMNSYREGKTIEEQLKWWASDKNKVEPQRTREEIIELATLVIQRIVPAQLLSQFVLNDGSEHAGHIVKWVEDPSGKQALKPVPINVTFGDCPTSGDGGYWTVSWTRKTPYGSHRCQTGSSRVIISDKYGIADIWPPTSTLPALENTDVSITAEKAQELARPAALKVFSTRNEWLKTHYKGLELGQVAVTELTIAIPTHIFDEGRDMLDFKRDGQARLLWEVTFYVKDKGAPDSAYLIGRTITVQVDAATGEILGGGFGL